MYPDVEIVQTKPTPEPAGGIMAAEPIPTIAPLTIPIPRVRLASVEIRDVATNQLVTSIEIISPLNKREPHLSRYRHKRERIRKADVHLLEIDLIRRGTRVWQYAQIPDVSYVIALTRAADNKMEVWPLKLSDPLPNLPIPLRAPDDDVVLDLSLALTTVYDDAYYHLSIDYQQDPPPPPLTAEEQAWMRRWLRTVQRNET